MWGNLYLLCCDGGDFQYAAALHKETGKLVWRTDRSFDHSAMNPDNRKAYNTPLVIHADGKDQLISIGAHRVYSYDVRTGKLLWTFHTVPQPGEFGADTWGKDDRGKESNTFTGNTGAWGPLTGDEELGFVYIPVEAPSGDTYGGQRPGANLFSDSVVCLDAKTGKRVWHYQLIHHEMWDYDIPAAPILLDLTVNGKKIKALAQVNKSAFTFVFDRTNGQPVWPIEECPVPKGSVPGEWYSPTQPFPTKPPAFDRQGVTEADLADYTPEIKAEA
jgi:quinoprotein glucose dehydrogenase